MKTVHLVFGMHWHAPIGFSDAAFEAVYQERFKHFISTLYELERFPLTLYYSGIVLELLEKNHPEYFNLLDEMIRRKQVELLGGGFYDPMLPLIPLIDKIGQIELTTTYLRSHFGKRPRGFWLSEQVWESSLPNTLKSCGIEFTFMNENAFAASHCPQRDLFCPHITEANGKNVTVFPLCTRLGDQFFLKAPGEIVHAITQFASADNERVVCVLIDGNRYVKQFVPGRNRKSVNWLKEFYARLSEAEKTVIPVLPSEYLRDRKIRRKIYFSGTISAAIYNATIPASCDDRNGRSSFSRNGSAEGTVSNVKQVFTKYLESNLLYSKMMYTHLTVHQMRGDKSRKRSALEELWKGQCHYGYWHGPHLGIYDNGLRKELYRSFINAEKYSRIKGSFLSSIINTDFDFDGENELLYQSNEMNVYVHILGGMVFELDHFPSSWNYCDTLTRIGERYRENSRMECDRYARKAFIEHFFTMNKKMKTESFSRRMIQLSRCPMEKYTLADLKREQRQITFTKNVRIETGRKNHELDMQKQYCFKKNTIIVNYVIANKGSQKLTTDFGSEINLSFLSPLKENLKISDATRKTPIELDVMRQERHHLKNINIEDRLNNVMLELSTQKPCVFYGEAVNSRALENGKIREQFQQLCLLPSWTLDLDAGEIWEGSLELSIQKY